MLYLEKKRCKPMSQRRGMEIAEIWPSAGVCLISLAHLITCLAAGVGFNLSELISPVTTREQDVAQKL